jgi:uncharacterized membrane protein
MMNGYLFVLTLVAALGCAMMAGVFFAFSAFVMKALARLPAEQGVAAMQAINVAAVTFAFMAALFGTAAACGALAVWALFAWDERFAPYLLVGSALYLIGTILLTIVYHSRETNRWRESSRTAPRATGGATSRAGPRGTTCGPPRPSLRRPRSRSRSMSRGAQLARSRSP